MRTLKKTLALVLCLAMIAGLCCFGTSAAFADADQIEKTEAVDVMNALGVLKGDGTNFNPKGVLTRAEAAVMLAKMLGGDKLVATSTFKDMKGYEWAQNFAAFCELKGLILGDGKGNFMPGKTLTGYEFGLMLCRALGYKPAEEGVSAATFEIGTAALMKKNGLSAAIKDFDGTVGLTRENAAALLLQTLKTPMVTYPVSGTTITVGDTVISTAGSAAAYVTAAATTSDRIGVLDEGGKDIVEFGEEYFPELQYVTTAIVNGEGVAAGQWKNGTPALPISQPTAAVALLKTFNVNGGDPFNFTNYLTVGDPVYSGLVMDAAAVVHTNGAPGTSRAALSDLISDLNAAKKAGSVVNFYDTDADGLYNVVSVINKSVATLSADAATKVVGKDTQVIVPGVPGMGGYTVSNTSATVTGYEGLVKGDVVLYWSDANSVIHLEKADVVEGVFTGRKGASGYVLNGANYYASALTSASFGAAGDYLNTYKNYLDNAGNVVKSVKVTSIAANYVYVETSAWVTGNGAIGSVNYGQAKLVKLDGTTEIVTVSKIDTNTVVGSSPAAGQALYSAADGKWVTYVLDAKGNYELTSVASDANSSANAAIAQGVSQFTSGVIGNNTTKFIVVTGTTVAPVYTVYTGINAVPSIQLSGGATYGYMKDLAGYVSAVYVDVRTNATVAGVAGEYVYLPGLAVSYTYTPANVPAGIPAFYTVDAIVNGEKTTIKVADVSASIVDTNGSAGGETTLTVNTLYKVTGKAGDGTITELTTYTTTNTELTQYTGFAVAEGVMQYGYSVSSTGATYSNSIKVDANTVVYYVDKLGAVTKTDIAGVVNDQTDKVYVVKTNVLGNLAETVYVVEQTSTTATVVGILYSVNGGAPVTTTASITSSAVTITGVTASKSFEIKAIYVAGGATYTVDGTSFTTATSGNDLTFNGYVTAEDGTTVAPYTFTVTSA